MGTGPKRAVGRRIGLVLLLLALSLAACAPGIRAGEPPVVLLPQQALTADELAVIVNDADPLSRRIGRYYAEARGIPAENLIRVRFPIASVMDPDTFAAIHRQVRDATPQGVQAYALTWAAPYRVGCMSITTAFAAGYDPAFCASPCELTRPSPLFASPASRPFDATGWRPTMALAGLDFESVKALIDRGLAADETRPPGTAYLVETSDTRRSVRARGFDRVRAALGSALRIEHIKADALTGKPDVLFYLTGAVSVPDIDTNRYRPGAVADHLTSSGGQLTDSRQMSSLRWLEAGATGSYGAVVEPCNFPSKFPDPGVLIAAYVTGATLIEAYWKSVEMPGQGIFIGEPLARPFGGQEVSDAGDAWELTTHALTPGVYRLEGAADPMGPYRTLGSFQRPGLDRLTLRLPKDVAPYLRILPAEAVASAGRDARRRRSVAHRPSG